MKTREANIVLKAACKTAAARKKTQTSTVFKGLVEIAHERGVTIPAGAPKQCTETRRKAMGCECEHLCKSDVDCCATNIIECQPDFKEQLCRLEELVISMGMLFLMMMICHPECNPIEDW